MTEDRQLWRDRWRAARERLRNDRRTQIAVTLGFLALLGAAVLLVQRFHHGGDPRFPVAGGERGKMEAVVRDYILEHPEIIPEAIKRLQEREVAKLLDSNRQAIETPFGGAWAGAAKGDVVLVEFFDYACPYCRVSNPDVRRLLAEDKKLKVVWRDLPVLGAASDEAATLSLAAARQNRFQAFHDHMFAAEGGPSHERSLAAVRAAGLNEIVAARDIASDEVKAEIGRNLELGKALGLTGTPSFVIGNRVLQGAVGYDELKKAIAQARAG